MADLDVKLWPRDGDETRRCGRCLAEGYLDPGWTTCGGCGLATHTACWEEAGRPACGTPGCSFTRQLASPRQGCSCTTCVLADAALAAPSEPARDNGRAWWVWVDYWTVVSFFISGGVAALLTALLKPLFLPGPHDAAALVVGLASLVVGVFMAIIRPSFPYD